jgi:HlyD family secretion protein
MKTLVAVGVAVLVVAGAGFWYWQAQTGAKTTFRFAEVHRGRLVATVGSTGTLQPSEIVDVGAQVVGRIISIGKDPNTQSKIVDWGSVVKGPVMDSDGNVVEPGTTLAIIDPDLYDAQLKSTKAAVLSAKADLLVKKANARKAQLDFERADKLIKEQPPGIAKAEFDQMEAATGAADAQVEVSAANIGVAEANLKTAVTNLNYATISSPVDGTVIDRRINVGQTVVASLSAPSLFLIAKDLNKMEVWATVNEVDVGRIRVGQDAKFSVDALPGKVFHGKVVPQGKLPFRLNATMNQNVVTYTVVVSADNSSKLLSPYLTTNVSFIIEDKKDALLVPNAALRWQPTKQQIDPDVREAYFELRGKKTSPTDPDTQGQAFVWAKGDNGYVRYVQIKIGLSDTVNTEVLGGDLPEKTQVIVAEGKAETQTGGANPFVATPFGKKKD